MKLFLFGVIMAPFFARGRAGKKTGLSAPSPRKAPMRFPVGFPLLSLARAPADKLCRKNRPAIFLPQNRGVVPANTLGIAPGNSGPGTRRRRPAAAPRAFRATRVFALKKFSNWLYQEIAFGNFLAWF
jgi:hypothetical protein